MRSERFPCMMHIICCTICCVPQAAELVLSVEEIRLELRAANEDRRRMAVHIAEEWMLAASVCACTRARVCVRV